MIPRCERTRNGVPGDQALLTDFGDLPLVVLLLVSSVAHALRTLAASCSWRALTHGA